MIELSDVHKSLSQNKVLDGLDLTVRRGENLVVIGRSGVGKSVLLKHISGLMKPDKGRIHIEGTEITHLDDTRLTKIQMKIGMVFQGAALFDSLNIDENVGFFLYRYRKELGKEKIRKIVQDKLALVGLYDVLDLKPAELSGGMKKRAGLARALAIEPEILLYDEPTTGLDPITADAINDLMIEMKKRLSVTSIIVTHDMVSAYKVADRIAMIYQGKIIFQGTPDQVKKTKDPFVHQFITGKSEGPIPY
ncbi:MAG: ABC transporter ATP-binding protein [Spirochaetes bacterium]|nr:ABC transporter ATP-binding protein [Spirochaetota bacterium]